MGTVNISGANVATTVAGDGILISKILDNQSLTDVLSIQASVSYLGTTDLARSQAKGYLTLELYNSSNQKVAEAPWDVSGKIGAIYTFSNDVRRLDTLNVLSDDNGAEAETADILSADNTTRSIGYNVKATSFSSGKIVAKFSGHVPAASPTGIFVRLQAINNNGDPVDLALLKLNPGKGGHLEASAQFAVV